MLLDNKGQIVSVPAGFDKMNRQSQEHFLASLREVHEPRSHKRASGFAIEVRAKLK